MHSGHACEAPSSPRRYHLTDEAKAEIDSMPPVPQDGLDRIRAAWAEQDMRGSHVGGGNSQ